jgi:hypothetical protein
VFFPLLICILPIVDLCSSHCWLVLFFPLLTCVIPLFCLLATAVQSSCCAVLCNVVMRNAFIFTKDLTVYLQEYLYITGINGRLEETSRRGSS